MSEQPPPRVAVTSPRAESPRPWPTTVAGEIDAQTRLGAVYMASLLRAQRRLAALVLGTLLVLLGCLPALFALVPSLDSADTAGLPLPWLLLGVVVYPVVIGAAWFYIRQAERLEQDFADLVERG